MKTIPVFTLALLLLAGCEGQKDDSLSDLNGKSPPGDVAITTILENFNDAPRMKWTGYGDEKKVAASCRISNGMLAITFLNSPVNGCWLRGELTTKVRLTGKFLTLRARTTDGQIRPVAVHLNKTSDSGESESFISYFDLTPEWQNFSFDITERTLSRLEATRGKFIFTDGSKNTTMKLSNGGILSSIMFSSRMPGDIAVDDIAFSAVPTGAEDEIAAIAAIDQAIAKHPKKVPYHFDETDAKTVIQLANDGKTDWVIAIPDSDKPVFQFAAAELKRYLDRVTGADFRIVPGGTAQSPAIALSIRAPSTAKDGFSSHGDAAGITIAANNPPSLAFAVYDWLEKAAEVRFYMPLDFGEVVPKNPNLQLPGFADTEQATMNYRRFHYCSTASTGDKLFAVADWNVKNRFNVQLERFYSIWQNEAEQQRKMKGVDNFYAPRGGRIAYVEYWGHNYHFFVPPSKYFSAHPEYFPFDRSNGQRRANQAQLCTTNADVIAIIAEKARDYFRKTPEARYFPVFQEDGATLWCQCDNCLAIVAPHRRNITGFNADRNLYLANAVCAAIKDEFPDRKIVTYAYSTSGTPPDVVMPDSGIYIEYCVYSDGEPDKTVYRTVGRRELERWKELTQGQMIIYSYHYLGFVYQFRTAKAMAEDFRYFALNGIDGSCQEAGETWGLNGYLMYLSPRLAWDPWFDIEAFEEDYFRGLYGSAAEPMRMFYQLTQRVFADNQKYLSIMFSKKPCFTPEEIAQLEQYQTKAEALTGNDARSAAAVAYNRKNLDYIVAFNRAIAAADHCLRQPNALNHQAVLDACDQLGKLIQAVAPKWVASINEVGHVNHVREMVKMGMENSDSLRELRLKHEIISCLDAPWRFKTDAEAVGNAQGYFDNGFDDTAWKQIRSGAFWEDQGFPNFDGAGWYRTHINLPENKQPLSLYFGGADERCWVYLDGKLIGAHEAGDIGQLWQEPFYIKIPAEATSGSHQLTVKVIDTAGGGGLWKDVYLVSEKK